MSSDAADVDTVASISEEDEVESESSNLWRAARVDRNEAAVTGLIRGGSTFTDSEWSDLASQHCIESMRAALDAGYRPSELAMCQALYSAAVYDEEGAPEPDEADEMVAILLTACDQFGPQYSKEVCRINGVGICEAARRRNRIPVHKPRDECHQLIRRLEEWFSEQPIRDE